MRLLTEMPVRKFAITIVLLVNFLLNCACGMNSDPNRQIVYEKCQGPGDPGPCKQFIYKWRFEITTEQCTTFIWSGCGGNTQNRFDTEAECLTHCIGRNYTMPPHISTTTASSRDPNANITAKEAPEVEAKIPVSKNSSASLQPKTEERPELVFQDSENERTPDKEFMFAQNNTFIQIDGDTIKTFQLRLCREISFQFRTRLPHGLLVYHNVKNPERIELDPYALYVIVEKGQLKVVHVFGKHSTSVIVGEGLNRDEWHNVTVRIDVHGARLIARVDNQQEEVYLKGLNHDTNYGVSTNLPSVVLVGGLSSEEKLHGVKYIIESFVGCIRNIVLKSGKAASDLLPISPLVASKHENVVEGCHNKCESRENLCFVGSRCINHFSSISCDCFGTKYEGEQCDIFSATVLTLRGSSFVSYRIYDWKDRTHSSVTRISILFKTWFDDSVLFYASGESIKPQYIAASLKNNKTYVEMDFGEGPVNATLGEGLASDYWHNLTILHDHKTVMVILDDQMKAFEGAAKNLLFDPEVYFGGGPDLNKKKGLASNNNFAGSFKNVFYNDMAVLYELKKGNPKVHYIGVLKPEFVEATVDVIPMTYPFATSHIWWPVTDKETNSLNLKFDFKSSRNAAVLAYSEVQTKEGPGYWEIRLTTDKISFDIVTFEKNMTIPTSIKIEQPTTWHSVELTYSNDSVRLMVDYRHEQTNMYGMSFNVGNKIIIGSSLRQPGVGLIGCMRDLRINGIDIEPRFVVKTERVVGEIALDNCQFVNPCERPNTCEHNGKCIVKNDRVTCDCKGTGYVGKNCHFTTQRRTCEELALLGYTKSDVYLIDIDGNGKFPPAHVKCIFQNVEEPTKTITIVEHNLPSQVDVRSTQLGDFYFDIKYREFSAEMLQELISHSLYCKQKMKYDCLKAPLDLNIATWFKSSHKNNMTIIDFIGNGTRGSCPCKQNRTCSDLNESCNCDKKENKWSSDEGDFTQPYALGITKMVFVQQKDLEEGSQGRITLGPLECVETNTQKYVVTFTTSQSYIEVPGWRKGDIAFSFRTTGEKAILLFQPPIRTNFPSFLVALTGDYQLTFSFTLNTGAMREMVINSTRKLNGGEWHKIWIDYNDYHVRFMINTNVKMVDLLPEEEFGPFEGSMYIGGGPSELLKKANVKQGLIGCFRGLVVNGEILDIYSYMSVHLSEIIKDCNPSCVKNPCRNGAQCKELWSNFQCVCKNRWAHDGEYCEINYNEKALTFTNHKSYLKKIYVNDSEIEQKLRGILQENLLVNIRTYDEHALILYAHDNANNFVHLYIANADEIVYLYNYGSEIVNLTVRSPNLNNGKSIQIAVIRTETTTTLHVNDHNSTLDKGVLLLDVYSNKPWINPQDEVISPHRPPAPTVKYFQFNIGGYDPTNLIRVNDHKHAGLVGCVRGLRIGNNTIDLPELAKTNEADEPEGVLNECQMVCDLEPCKNGGICFENFAKKESNTVLCNCENTSFLGETCTEEKGAEFSGESGLQRNFVLSGRIDSIKLQFAFSTGDLRHANRIMVLLQTESANYYLMIAITDDGYLSFNEQHDGVIYTTVSTQNYANNARHSIYYRRHFDDVSLLIDRVAANITKTPPANMTQNLSNLENRVMVGGYNDTIDPRFSVYKSYSGCLSNFFLDVNNQSMKPLEEYMMFTKAEHDKIVVINPTGLRAAQCSAHFEVMQKLIDEPMNYTSGADKNWVPDSPLKNPYEPVYVDSAEKEEQTQVVFIILITLFVVIIICCLIEVYRTDRAHKRRIERETDESIILSREQAKKMQESSSGKFAFKPTVTDLDAAEVKKKVVSEPSTPLVGILKNGGAKGGTGDAEKPTRDPNAGFRESQLIDHEPAWDSLLSGSQNSLKTPNIDEDANDTDPLGKYDDSDKKLSFKPMRQRQFSFPPPTLNTQLPFKLEEEADEGNDDDDDESEIVTNGFDIGKLNKNLLL